MDKSGTFSSVNFIDLVRFSLDDGCKKTYTVLFNYQNHYSKIKFHCFGYVMAIFIFKLSINLIVIQL